MPIPDRIDLVAGVSRQDDPGTTGTEVVDRLMDRDDWLDANKEASGAAAAAVTAHEAAADPHPGYTTAVELAAGLSGKSNTGHTHPYEAAGAVAAHEAAADPHPQYETSGEAAAKVSAHEAAADPHTGYQRESEKGSANGYASLDGSTRVPAAQLPTVAQGQAGIVPAISGTPSSSRVLAETGWKDEAAGGSSVGVLRYVSGGFAPAAGLGVDDDWAVNDRSTLHRKISGTWTVVGRLNNFAKVFTDAGWSLGGTGGTVKPPPTSHASWTKTNLAAQSGSTINFAGSSANASAKLAFPAEGRRFDTAYIRVTLTTMPVGGAYSFGVGVTPFGPVWPQVSVSPAGVVTVITGGGATITTLPGTAAANDLFSIQVQPGAVLIGWLGSGFDSKAVFLFASEFVNRENLSIYGAGLEVYGAGTLTAGRIDWSMEVML